VPARRKIIPIVRVLSASMAVLSSAWLVFKCWLYWNNICFSIIT